jgi:hypothetical protein
MTLKRTLAAALVAATVAVPATADARGGAGGGGGGVPAPPPASTACATLKSTTPALEITSTSHKAVTLGWEVANCSTATETLTTTVVPTAYRVDGTCVGAPFSAGTVTLKPGEKRSLSAQAPSDPCNVVGPTGLVVMYDATTRDASGASLASASSGMSVIFRGF